MKGKPLPTKTCRRRYCANSAEGGGSLPAPTRRCFARICGPGSLLHILTKTRLSSRTARSRTLLLPQRNHRCALANYGFAAVVAAPKLAGLRHLGCFEAEGQPYGSPKNGRSEVNPLANAGCQSLTMLRRNCRMLRPRLEKVVAISGGNSDQFSSYCPCLSLKTIFWGQDYVIAKLLRILVKNRFTAQSYRTPCICLGQCSLSMQTIFCKVSL